MQGILIRICLRSDAYVGEVYGIKVRDSIGERIFCIA